jgi:long-chain acyl-CoA synthetase
MNPKAPWLKNLGDIPSTIAYRDGSMFEALESASKTYPDGIVYDFMGTRATYLQLTDEVRRCAKALRAYGIREGERVTICMPNVPQTVVMFYAVNLIGAVSSMLHPLSSASEIEDALRDAKSVACLTLDMNYDKLRRARLRYPLKHLIITTAADMLPAVMRLGYAVTEGRRVKKVPQGAPVIYWHYFIPPANIIKSDSEVKKQGEDAAVILYSGGTTGKTKGILLSNLNFNALAAQIVAANPIFKPGDSMLAVMPMFHGFGLGVCIHSMVANGGRCILIPRFNAESYAGLLKKYRPNFIAGVPTLYEALLRNDSLKEADLSCLKGVFSGGDSLPVSLKRRFDEFLENHGATVKIREGYGTTECVTASCLTPLHMEKEGSIGLPFPDMFFKIVYVDTENECPYGEEGEICLSGPTVMLGYDGNSLETENVLKRHRDGRLWVHTGDLGVMDSDGFLYFRQRIKRMIVTSGYNVYPSQVESVLDAHEKVLLSCVIGVPDTYKMKKVKAFVVLKPGVTPTDAIKAELTSYCREKLIRYAQPYDIEFRDNLPKTLVGKVAYRLLEEEEASKQ